MVFDVFTLSKSATIADFGYYSYFEAPRRSHGRRRLRQHNWSIWARRRSPTNAPAHVWTARHHDKRRFARADFRGLRCVTVDGLDVHLDARRLLDRVPEQFRDQTKGIRPTRQRTNNSSVYYGQAMPAITPRRYKQVAFYIDGTYDTGGGGLPPPPPPGVPEPSTWAMTLFGFAGLGWLARRRVRRRRLTRSRVRLGALLGPRAAVSRAGQAGRPRQEAPRSPRPRPSSSGRWSPGGGATRCSRPPPCARRASSAGILASECSRTL